MGGRRGPGTVCPSSRFMMALKTRTCPASTSPYQRSSLSVPTLQFALDVPCVDCRHPSAEPCSLEPPPGKMGYCSLAETIASDVLVKLSAAAA